MEEVAVVVVWAADQLPPPANLQVVSKSRRCKNHNYINCRPSSIIIVISYSIHTQHLPGYVRACVYVL